MKRRYFEIRDVLKKHPGMTMYFIFGERSNGKTYSCLDLALEEYAEHGWQAAYIRRSLEDVKTKYSSGLYTGHISNGRFDKFFGDEASAVVTFSRKRNNKTLEVTVTDGPVICRAEAEEETFQIALDRTMETIERQLRKNKTRLARRLRQDAFTRTVQEETSFAPEVAEDDLSITRVKSFYFKPMTREEAVLQMNLLEHSFFAFRDEDNGGTFAVVYRRNDGGYGIIDDVE